MTKFEVKIKNEKMLENLTGYPEFLRILLWNRGIKTKEQAEAFLQPNYDQDLADPFLFPDMDKAVERIIQSLEKKEKIVIFSDYDADGIPGAVILHDFLKKVGHDNFSNYIPHRDLEGFGLNKEAIDEFKKENVNLIITVDCGIADVEEAQIIKEHGIDLIITDHHLPTSALPQAIAVIDPKRADCTYPFKELCGAGVAFKLVQAVLIKLREQKNSPSDCLGTIGLPVGWEKWLLDLVAISTLSDMVPLVGENRVLAFYGLKVLRKTPRLGLLKLFRLLKIDSSQITEDDVGFSISPRINAASRMGDPEDAFKLFIAENDVEADICAKHLDKINSERKGVVASLVKEVRKIMRERLEKDEAKKVLVIGNPDWKPSLLGLVANSLVDDHSCPVFLWGRDGGNILKGSCRSDGVVSLAELMSGVEEGIFQEFGGHNMSGGFSLNQEKVHLLEEKLQISYESLISRFNLDKGLSRASVGDEGLDNKADMKLELDQVNSENYRLLEKLAPFGVANTKPIFLFKKVRIKDVRNFGKEFNHLEIILDTQSWKTVKAVGFFMKKDDWGVELKAGNKINLLANFEKSVFRGFTELRLRIVEIENVL